MVHAALDWRGWRRALLAVALGAVLALALHPFDLPIVNLVVLPLLALAIARQHSFWAGFGFGWLVGLGYFALALSWIIEPFLVDAARTGWMAPFGLFGMAGGMALFWGLAFGISGRLARGGPGDALVLAAVWGLVELARGYVLTGFAWAQLAQGLVDTPFAQWVAFAGAPGLGAAVMLCAGLLGWRRSAPLGAVVLLLLSGVGYLRSTQPLPPDTGLNVRLVQPNADQRLKWNRDLVYEFYLHQLNMTADGDAADIVIWPEAAIAYLPDEDPELRQQIATAARGAPVILGARRREAGQWYNSLFVITPDAAIAAQYDKVLLAPFGEYMPFNDAAAAIGMRGLADIIGGGLQFGAAPAVLVAQGVPPFQPLICYEAIFPQFLLSDPRAAWLVQITNDSWFGKFSGPYQHLAQARLRAIEQGLPLARAANTGVSAMIDPLGHIVAQTPLDQRTALDVVLPGALGPTLYSRTGDMPAGLVLLALFGWAVARRRR